MLGRFSRLIPCRDGFQGGYYFHGVWTQAQTGLPGQTDLLLALAAAPAPLPESAALTTLLRHDVLTATDGLYDFTVPLMRRWLRENKSPSA